MKIPSHCDVIVIALFSNQFRGLLQIARLLALCQGRRLGVGKSVYSVRKSTRARTDVRRVCRDDPLVNLEMAKIKDGRIITSDKFRVLEEIAF